MFYGMGIFHTGPYYQPDCRCGNEYCTLLCGAKPLPKGSDRSTYRIFPHRNRGGAVPPAAVGLSAAESSAAPLLHQRAAAALCGGDPEQDSEQYAAALVPGRPGGPGAE